MNTWDKLSMTEKAEIMRLAVSDGIYDLDTIRDVYNKFAEGGQKRDSSWTMEDEAGYREWRNSLPANLRNTDDNLYDMRGAYKAEMQPTLEADGRYHLQSRDPKTGRILKSPLHPTYLQAIATDASMGYYPTIDNQGNTYTQTWEGNKFSGGGSIHIKPSHRGRLTELKKRTGKSEAELYNDGNPAHKKMVVFARNARKWKHGDGGNLYDGGGLLEWFKSLFSSPKEDTPPTYRGRPAKVFNGVAYPKRLRNNNSPTQAASTHRENQMRQAVVKYQNKSGGSDPAYDIPFIPQKAIVIDGTTTSTNALDSLAKYAGIHNRNPRLSEKPIMHSSKYKAPREINKDEMLGLSTQETHNGAWPYFNMDGDKEYNRAVGNSNYFTAFGYIPADNFVRDYHYNDAGVDRETPPLLDAFRYFAQGDYNRNDPNHTKDVNAAGKKAWENPDVKNWWELSGKYWYNTGKGPKK